MERKRPIDEECRAKLERAALILTRELLKDKVPRIDVKRQRESILSIQDPEKAGQVIRIAEALEPVSAQP